jgi:Molybdopterin-binding domain of aldehyde dehydrogenase
MRNGHHLVGWGMATATFPSTRSPSAAKMRILQDGSAMVISATQDMGGGVNVATEAAFRSFARQGWATRGTRRALCWLAGGRSPEALRSIPQRNEV